MSCAVCQSKAFYVCGKCKAQTYCGTACQYADAHEHLSICQSVPYQLVGGPQEEFLAHVDEYVIANRLDRVQQGIASNYLQKEDLNRVIQFANTIEMARTLVSANADVYTYIGNGMVALDEMVKHYSILEFLQEAREPTPWIVQQMLIKVRESPQQDFIEFRVSELEPEFGIDFQQDWNVVRHMIYNNLFPTAITIESRMLLYVEHLFFHRYNEDTLVFWMAHKDVMLGLIQGFTYKSLAQMIRDAEKNPDSFRLLLFAPHMVYKGSKRAKTSMSMFFENNPPKILRLPPLADPLNIANFVPVARYAAGMSKSLFPFYFTDPNQQYCGTFYYREPESTTFLRYDHALTAFDKVDAAKQLGVTIPERKGDMSYYDVHLYKGGLMMKPFEFTMMWHQKHGYQYEGRKWANMRNLQGNRHFYTAHLLSYYALQDELDQPICEAARVKGYDLVLLTHMVGSRQLVYEVLDTRPRQESFANLYVLKK